MKRLLWAIVMVVGVALLGATQTTPNLGLGIPAHGTLGWDSVINNNMSLLDNFLTGAATLPGTLKVTNINISGSCTGSGCGSGGNFVAGGDLSGTSTNQTVEGLEGNPLPTLGGTSGFLYWNGSSLLLQSAGGVTGSGASTRIAVWSGSGSITGFSGLTSDSSGNLTANSVTSGGVGTFLSLATTGSNAGLVGLAAGTDNSGACATSNVCDEAPSSATAYTIVRAGSAPSAAGVAWYGAVSGGKTTQSFVTPAYFSLFAYCNSTFPTTSGTNIYEIDPFETAITSSSCTTLTTGTGVNMRAPVTTQAGLCNMYIGAGANASSSGVIITFNDVTQSTSITDTITSTNAGHVIGASLPITANDALNVTVTTQQGSETFANPRVSIFCW